MRTLLLQMAAPVVVAILCMPAFAQKGMVTSQLLERYQQQVDKNHDVGRTINAVTNNKIKELSLNRDLIVQHDKLVNYKLKGTSIINQRSSGRCWMFAGVNVLAPKVMTNLKLSDFELSEAYLAFWDKLEKSNRYLEMMIALSDTHLDDRSLQMYIESPLGDGGWWHYFTDLIEKYGVVPTTAMPETKQSTATGTMNKLIKSLLRSYTAELRSMHQQGKKENDLRARKEEMLADIYSLLVYTYGMPPKEFRFRWEDKDDSTSTVLERTYTPTEFYHEFYGEQMPEYVALVSNPSMDLNQLFEINSSRNIEEKPDQTVLNLPVSVLKDYALRALLDSQIIWFACDVGKENYRDSGILAVDIYDYNRTFGVDFKMSKTDRIQFRDITPNHAMVFTGVDTASDGSPRKWLVENSWGKKKGDDGYWYMYDNWFDEYVLMIIVDKAMLDDDLRKMFSQKPKQIADWEPFFVALRNLDWSGTDR